MFFFFLKLFKNGLIWIILKFSFLSFIEEIQTFLTYFESFKNVTAPVSQHCEGKKSCSLFCPYVRSRDLPQHDNGFLLRGGGQTLET